MWSLAIMCVCVHIAATLRWRTITWHLSCAVSYTHLDVYKRQVSDKTSNFLFISFTESAIITISSVKRVLWMSLPLILMLLVFSFNHVIASSVNKLNKYGDKTKNIFVWLLFLCWLLFAATYINFSLLEFVQIQNQSSIPVSYTHLDVYKRQHLLRVQIH